MVHRSGREAIAEILRSEGVTHVFGNPGTTELPLLRAIAADRGLRYVLGLQEGAVLAMAGGFALAAGRLSAALLHAAPGLGNAMGMLYDASKAGAPLLVICGQHEQSFAVTEPVLWADLPQLARPLVKWAAEIRSARDIPRMLRRAAKTATAPPAGPVFLSIPYDVMAAEADIDLGAPTRVEGGLRASPDAIAAAAALLAAAQHPVIVAGDSVARTGASQALADLAQSLGAPVFTECVANTTPLPPAHALSRGPLSRLAPAVRAALADYDVLLSVGADLFTLSLPSAVDPMPEGMTVIHIDADPWELGENYPVAAALLADPAGCLPELTAALKRHPAVSAIAEARGAAEAQKATRAAAALLAGADSEPAGAGVRASALYRALSPLLPDDAIIVEEAISAAPGIREWLVGSHPNSFFGLRGGGIGWGLAAAIGVKLAHPDRQVVALIGDGSALYNCQALWTAAREKLSIVFIILNNRGYAILDQRAGDGGPLGAMTALSDPAIDIKGLATSFGVHAVSVDAIADAAAAVREALGRRGPSLIDVAIS